jgi:two-component system sensor histidine kinase AgrC
MKNRYTISALIVLGLAFLLVAALVIFSFYFTGLFQKPCVISFDCAAFVIGILIIIATISLMFLARNMFLIAKQKKILDIQDFYIEHLNEMVRVIRTQRHDFINHLQVVYALMNTKKLERAQQYIEELCQTVHIPCEALHVNMPELSALLLAKEELATAKNISFKIIIDSDLVGFNVKPLDLITVIGNLLDNAFEAVEEFPMEKRNVVIKIFQIPRHFVFQIINPGFIPKHQRKKIFELGYSTKKGKGRGVGLSSVASVVEKNSGKIIVSSNKERGTKFTVMFPV